ncbi:MAG: Rieske (2Fe-2S) protein [Bdellovibrionales bacterium]|nr:Rieske (2Fe-2S) protein [Bdellovibrionales bacterium]
MSTRRIKVAKKSELAVGKGKAVMIQGQEIAVFHTEEGFFACENACLHQGAPLDQGDLQGCMVICPWHAWKFNLKDGSFVSDPAFALKTYPVISEGEDLWIEFPSKN